MKSLLILCMTTAAAYAQEVNLGTLDDGANRIHVSTGAEYGFVAGLGYSRVFPVLDRNIVITGEATLPWASFDAGDYRVRAAVLVPVVERNRWKLAAAIAPTLRGTHTKVNDMTDLGADMAVVAGYYSRAWFAALEGGVDFALTTHVTHTDAYRMNVHADAKDGWYANAGANLRSGAQGGVSFARYDVILRAGVVRDTDGNPPLIPFYATADRRYAMVIPSRRAVALVRARCVRIVVGNEACDSAACNG